MVKRHTGRKAVFLIVLLLAITGISYGAYVLLQGVQPVQTEPTFGFSLPIEGWVSDKYDESPTTSYLEGLPVSFYVVDGPSGSGRLFREATTTTASAAGRFRSAQTYESGEWVLIVINGNDGGTQVYCNASIIVQMPFYTSEYPPTYHYLDKVLTGNTIKLEFNPTLLPRGYQSTGALFANGFDTNIQAADYDISGNGTLTTMTFEILGYLLKIKTVYNTVDESGLESWYDYTEGYKRTMVFVFVIPKYCTGTTAAVDQDKVIITSTSVSLYQAKAPTTSQDGVWVCELSNDAVDVDKNQQTGLYTKRNSFKIDITFDFSSCGANTNFSMYCTVWKDTNLNNWQQAGQDTNLDTNMFTGTSYLLAVAA